MFYVSYVLAELRRRRGRTILTALGLAVGVGLVVTVNSLSTGLDHAQRKVLEPLTGVGTDMTVSRPIKITSNGGGTFGSLSQAQRNRLRSQAGPGPGFNFRNLKPGQKFNSDTFRATSQLSFPGSEVTKISHFAGVAAVAGSLTLTDTDISGTAPRSSSSRSRQSFGQSGRRRVRRIRRQWVPLHRPHGHGGRPDPPRPGRRHPQPDHQGTYFTGTGAYQAILSSSYASTNKLAVGSTITLGGHAFHVIGIASSPLGGTPSDAYVKLATLQKLAKYGTQINALAVRATSTGNVSLVSHEITTGFSGAQVTTAQDLANRISGSLTDAKNLSSKLGTALEIVGLAAAVLIACLLTLASVAKRVREIGTLKAVGWSQWQVVRQISGESLVQGLLGGLIGAVIGVAGAAAVNAVGWTLKATVPGASTASRGGFGGAGSAGAARSASARTRSPRARRWSRSPPRPTLA